MKNNNLVINSWFGRKGNYMTLGLFNTIYIIFKIVLLLRISL